MFSNVPGTSAGRNVQRPIVADAAVNWKRENTPCSENRNDASPSLEPLKTNVSVPVSTTTFGASEKWINCNFNLKF